MKRATLLALGLAFALGACTDQPAPTESTDAAPPDAALTGNPAPESWGDLPPLDLSRFTFPPPMAQSNGGGLTPDVFVTTLRVGETDTEDKEVDVPEVPPKGDVLFSFDLTGSMGGELTTVKTHGVDIMNDIAVAIPDANFGLISHEDYPGSFQTSSAAGHGCDYPPYDGTTAYGSSSAGDEPYRLDRSGSRRLL